MTIEMYCEEIDIKLNKILFTEGDPIDYIYIIQSGQIELSMTVDIKNKSN